MTVKLDNPFAKGPSSESWSCNVKKTYKICCLPGDGIGPEVIAEGKKVININGQDYLLELPLRADMAFVKGTIGDETGNLVYKGTTQNFQPLMAMAADCVVAEIDEIVPVGQISPEAVHTSGIFVDYIFE